MTDDRRRERLIALAPEMVECLKAVEWAAYSRTARPQCVVCRNIKIEGHTHNCRLGNLLTKMEG